MNQTTPLLNPNHIGWTRTYLCLSLCGRATEDAAVSERSVRPPDRTDRLPPAGGRPAYHHCPRMARTPPEPGQPAQGTLRKPQLHVRETDLILYPVNHNWFDFPPSEPWLTALIFHPVNHDVQNITTHNYLLSITVDLLPSPAISHTKNMGADTNLLLYFSIQN